jgi:hypothetical protein
VLTTWEAGLTNSPPVANKIHVRSIHLSWWNEWFEHGMRTLSRASGGEQTEPCRDSMDMRIDREGWMATGEEEDASHRLRPHTGKLG